MTTRVLQAYKKNHWVVGDPLYMNSKGEWEFSSDDTTTHFNHFIDYSLTKQLNGEDITIETMFLIDEIVETTLMVDKIIERMKNNYKKIQSFKK